MRYPGGKSKCFQKLINLIPPHRVYIETHLGGGAVLRKKAPADTTIGIDRNPKVIGLFTGKYDSSYRFILGTAEEFIKNYPFAGGEFVYADPPYLASSIRAKRSPYRFHYTETDHLNLIRLLRTLPCNVMVSGYSNPIYDRELSRWNRHHFIGSSHVGPREETVWMNYQPTVLHDTAHLGDSFHERQSIRRKRARWRNRFRGEPVAIQQALLADLTKVFSTGRNAGSSKI